VSEGKRPPRVLVKGGRNERGGGARDLALTRERNGFIGVKKEKLTSRRGGEKNKLRVSVKGARC